MHSSHREISKFSQNLGQLVLNDKEPNRYSFLKCFDQIEFTQAEFDEYIFPLIETYLKRTRRDRAHAQNMITSYKKLMKDEYFVKIVMEIYDTSLYSPDNDYIFDLMKLMNLKLQE